MTSTLNKFVYNYDIFSSAESISILEQYMVGSHELPIILTQEQDKTIPEITQITSIKTDKFIPKNDDTLFWSIFIAKYGLKEFYNVDRYKNREIDEKCKIMEYLKSLSKTDIHLTKCSVQEIMGDLLTNKTTTLFIINALCMYYKMNFLFVYGNTYLEFDLKKLLVCTDCSEIPIGIIYKKCDDLLYKTGTNKYAVDLYVTQEKIQIIQNTMVRLQTYNRPLLGISTYKITDLETMLIKLNLDNTTTKKPTKKEIYEIIWRNCIGFAII